MLETTLKQLLGPVLQRVLMIIVTEIRLLHVICNQGSCYSLIEYLKYCGTWTSFWLSVGAWKALEIYSFNNPLKYDIKIIKGKVGVYSISVAESSWRKHQKNTW